MSEFSLTQFTDVDRNLWNDFVSVNPYAYAFHLWEWGDVLCKTYDHKRYYLAVKYGKDLLGALPLFLIRSNIFGDKLVSLPFCEYGGPLVSESEDSHILQRSVAMLCKGTVRLARKLKVDYAELRNPPPLPSSFLSSLDFASFQRYLTFRIDLTKSESELWAKLKRDVRRRVSKARKIGIRIKDVKRDRVKDYYELYLSTQKKHGSPPHSYDFFLNLYDAFKPGRLLQMVFATYDGLPIAGDIFFSLNGRMNTWSGVMDLKYRNLYPTHLLFWHMIKWGHERNIKFFDLGRTRFQAEGVYFFKSRWGGTQIKLNDYLFPAKNAEIPDPAQGRYMYLSKLWSLLPYTLTRKVGPMIISDIGL